MEFESIAEISETSTSRFRDLNKAGPLLTTASAAELLGVSPSALRLLRMRGKGPRHLYVRIQSREAVLYSLSDLQSFALEEVRARGLLVPKQGGSSR